MHASVFVTPRTQQIVFFHFSLSLVFTFIREYLHFKATENVEGEQQIDSMGDLI